MKKISLTLAILFVVVLGITSGIVLGLKIGDDTRSYTDTTAVVQSSIRSLECQLIRADIEVIGSGIGLSPRQQHDYVRYIDSAATRFKLPPMLLHAIIYIESAYDPSARHPQIRVKGQPTFAVGLTGIVWEYHGDSLKKAGIAYSRLELTEPNVNIMASGYILHNFIVSILKNNPELPENRLFDELIRKYYGAYDETYKGRMLARIRDTASRQWINRVTQDIFMEFKTK